MFKITVKTHFSGAHFLREYEGKCEKMHGHNWIVEATLQGESLNEAGMLIDFTLVKKHLNGIVDELDHTLLNEHAEFSDVNPSAEIIARYIFNRLKAVNDWGEVRVREVCVHESESSRATYSES